MICVEIFMKRECFAYITDPIDYLNNNLIIAYYCGFDINRKLPICRAYFMLRFPQTPIRTIRNPSRGTSLLQTSLPKTIPIHIASNQHNEKKYEFFLGYKAMSSLIASAVCPCASLRQPQMLQIIP